MRLTVITVIIVVLAILTSHLAATLRHRLSRTVRLCGSDLSETYSLLCYTPRYESIVNRRRRDGMWRNLWNYRPQARVTGGAGWTLKENDHLGDFSLQKRQIPESSGLATLCCDRECTYQLVLEHCTLELSTNEILTNLARLDARRRVVVTRPIPTTTTTEPHGYIATGAPSNQIIFSYEALQK